MDSPAEPVLTAFFSTVSKAQEASVTSQLNTIIGICEMHTTKQNVMLSISLKTAKCLFHLPAIISVKLETQQMKKSKQPSSFVQLCRHQYAILLVY